MIRKVLMLSIMAFLSSACVVSSYYKPGQTNDQATKDQKECYRLANEKMGYDPDRQVMLSREWQWHYETCMEERGYKQLAH